MFESHVDGLVQDCSNSSVLAVELMQSCTKPSIYVWDQHFNETHAKSLFNSIMYTVYCLPIVNEILVSMLNDYYSNSMATITHMNFPFIL